MESFKLKIDKKATPIVYFIEIKFLKLTVIQLQIIKVLKTI